MYYYKHGRLRIVTIFYVTISKKHLTFLGYIILPCRLHNPAFTKLYIKNFVVQSKNFVVCRKRPNNRLFCPITLMYMHAYIYMHIQYIYTLLTAYKKFLKKFLKLIFSCFYSLNQHPCTVSSTRDFFVEEIGTELAEIHTRTSAKVNLKSAKFFS